MPYTDPEKRKAYNRQYNAKSYSNNSSPQKERTKKRRKELSEWFKDYKRTKACSVCGERHIACLEFHHTVSVEKDIDPGNFVRKGWGKDRMFVELEKLVVLCANCHRKLHYPIS